MFQTRQLLVRQRVLKFNNRIVNKPLVTRPKVSGLDLYGTTLEFEPKKLEQDASWYENTILNASNTVPKWMKAAEKAAQRKEAIAVNMQGPITIDQIVYTLEQEAGQDIKVMDLR